MGQPTPSPPAPTKRPTNQPTERPTQRPADPTSRPTDRPTERPNNPTPNPQPTPNPFGPGCDDLIPMAVQTQMNGYKEQVAAAQAEVAALKKQLAEMTGKTINEVQAESVNNRKLRAGSKWVPMQNDATSVVTGLQNVVNVVERRKQEQEAPSQLRWNHKGEEGRPASRSRAL